MRILLQEDISNFVSEETINNTIDLKKFKNWIRIVPKQFTTARQYLDSVDKTLKEVNIIIATSLSFCKGYDGVIIFFNDYNKHSTDLGVYENVYLVNDEPEFKTAFCWIYTSLLKGNDNDMTEFFNTENDPNVDYVGSIDDLEKILGNEEN